MMGAISPRTLTPRALAYGKVMLAFEGVTPPPELLALLRQQPVAGVTLFRHSNVASPAQVRALTGALQQAAMEGGRPPLLIGADQEGGQFLALGEGVTPFPGNLALGATRSTRLAGEVGYAMGRELAAMGVNLNYAPACDVNTNPNNPVIGTRSFGEETGLVATLAAAMVTGLQRAGVAATAKHFPGHGDSASDSHHGLPVLPHTEARLRCVEWPPFTAAIEAGVRLVMTAHLALPALQGEDGLPVTLSATLLRGLLREQLGFRGVIISDAMDMQGVTGVGGGMVAINVAAAGAGVDLLLLTTLLDQEAICAGLARAVREGELAWERAERSVGRILALKRWVAEQPQPDLSVVGSADHRSLAQQVADRSVTLVRDEAGLLPLRLPSEARLAVIVPEAIDLTPADTSSTVTCRLAAALRHRHARTEEIRVAHRPNEAEIARLCEQARDYAMVVIGTINAFDQPAQAALVRGLLATGVPLIGVAMRMPYDLQAFPALPTYLCSYSILEPSMEAVARLLWGEIRPEGRLPVRIPGLYPVGYRFSRGEAPYRLCR